MKSLFVIGNGFDLSHGLKTRYKDFYAYLQNEYPGATDEGYIQPEVYITPNGGEACDDVVAVSFLMRIISATSGGEWNDIETTLGYLDFSEWFDIDYPLDREGDVDFFKKVYLNEDIASNFVVPFRHLSKYFADWINTIELTQKISAKRDFARLLDINNDLFLSFNYTKTLETLYNVRNVCHIHGKQGEELLFGHGNDEDYYEEHMDKFTGAESTLLKIHDLLKKDTINSLEKYRSFFDSVSGVGRVYSYGFSFSDVDQIYIKEICLKLPKTKVIWYLNEYDGDKIEGYKKTIIACGFKGEFETYNIKK